MGQQATKASKSLTVRQRARQKAKRAAAEERQRLDSIEKKLMTFLVAAERHEEALKDAGSAAQELYALGMSEKDLASKTGVEIADIRRGIKLFKQAESDLLENEESSFTGAEDAE